MVPRGLWKNLQPKLINPIMSRRAADPQMALYFERVDQSAIQYKCADGAFTSMF
jgi:hypothetical protein